MDHCLNPLPRLQRLWDSSSMNSPDHDIIVTRVRAVRESVKSERRWTRRAYDHDNASCQAAQAMLGRVTLDHIIDDTIRSPQVLLVLRVMGVQIHRDLVGDFELRGEPRHVFFPEAWETV